MKKSEKNGKNIVLWILTAFFALTFFVYIPHIASFIALAVAVFLVPIPTWQEILGRYVKRGIKTIAIIALVILTLITIPTSEPSENDIPSRNHISASDETTEATQNTSVETEAMNVTTTESFENPTTEAATEPKTEPTKDLTTEPTMESTAESIIEATEDEGQDYVLNTNTKKFHYPSCNSADDIKTSNRKEYHGTREELIEKGYEPCGNCKP